MKLLRTIRADASDTFVFERAAEPGEWAVSGAFAFALQGRPLAGLREALQRLGVERAPGRSEPEDHAAMLMEIMSALAGGRIAAPPGAEREMFEHHVAPYMGRFLADLEKAGPADFYARVGALGRTFIEIETEAFEILA